MKAHIIARKNIIAAATEKRLTDAELEIMGGLLSGPEHEIELLSEDMKSYMIDEFKKLNPTFHNVEFQFVVK